MEVHPSSLSEWRSLTHRPIAHPTTPTDRPTTEYGQVLRMLGNGRCECYCFDGKNRLAHIRGKMRKKVWVSAGDIVLLGMRDYQEDKVDIIHKYNADEARNLKAFGELPETAKINETAIDLTMDGGSDSEDELGVDFDDVSWFASSSFRAGSDGRDGLGVDGRGRAKSKAPIIFN